MTTPMHIEQAADAILEVLEAVGIPGAGLAQYALRGIKGLRQSAEAKSQLYELLQQAEAEFVRRAVEAGLQEAAGWVHDMPQRNRPAFEQALQTLLIKWEEQKLQHLLEQEFAGLSGVPSGKARQAAALYMIILRDHLARHPYFKEVITTTRILAIDRRTEELQVQLAALYQTITVLLGMPQDILVWPVEKAPAGELRATLLHPKYRLITYTGTPYENARNDLLAWARGLEGRKGMVGLRVYTAPGGAGKTRLFIEAGEALRQEGWWVGFLPQGRLDNHAPRLMGDARPTLLVVDYTADRQKEVEALLTAAADAVRTGTRTAPLAIIFLERYFPDWLKVLLHRASDPSYVDWGEFLNLPAVERAPHELPTLSDPQARLAFFEGARDQLIRWMGAHPSDDRVTYPAERLPETPLYLSLLALHAAAGRRLPDPSDEQRILEYTWNHEKDAWKRCLQPWMEGQGVTWAMNRVIEYVEKLSVLVTLGRPFPDAPSLAGFLREHFPPIRNAVGQTLDTALLAEQMPCVFPQAKGRGSLIPPVEPDPLADYVLWQVLPGDAGLIGLALPAPAEAKAAPAAWAARAWHLCSVLARLWESAAVTDQHQVEDWMQTAVKALEMLEAPREFWYVLEGQLPQQTVLFRRLAVLVTQRALEHTPAEDAAERARLLNNLAGRLGELGRREEALLTAEEAAGMYRRLAGEHPEAFLPALAMSLNNLATFYSELGRREEALRLAEEAVGMYRRLAGEHPEAFLPALAKSLNNLANRLSELDRREEALERAQEAVQTLAPFFAGLPLAFAHWMTVFLRSYLRICGEAGAEPALDLPPAVQEGLWAVGENPGLPAEVRELARRLASLGRP